MLPQKQRRWVEIFFICRQSHIWQCSGKSGNTFCNSSMDGEILALQDQVGFLLRDSNDSIATVGEIRVYQRADFQSGSRVLKKVFWTFSYLYLWHTMWFHAKKLLRTLKFWKSLNSLCKSGSRPQKSPKKAQKTDHSIAIYSNFWIGMVYFGYHLVKAHVQTVQNMYGKGG